MSDTDVRQALAFIKTLLDNFDAEQWELVEGGSVTCTESFRTVTLWRDGDDVVARVATNAGTEVILSGADHALVRQLGEAATVQHDPHADA